MDVLKNKKLLGIYRQELLLQKINAKLPKPKIRKFEPTYHHLKGLLYESLVSGVHGENGRLSVKLAHLYNHYFGLELHYQQQDPIWKK